jgi:hypothetical protein
MVVLEVLSGQPPFANYEDDLISQMAVRGEHPARPEGATFTGDLWRILEHCWSLRPRDRPAVEAVLECLEQVSVNLQSGVRGEAEGELARAKVIIRSLADSLPQILQALQWPASRLPLRAVVWWRA